MEHAQRAFLSFCAAHTSNSVLILILMEHAQRDSRPNGNSTCKRVLILILMEHAQRVVESEGSVHHRIVLILILMEHAQRDFTNIKLKKMEQCLNPYFNGTCSKR